MTRQSFRVAALLATAALLAMFGLTINSPSARADGYCPGKAVCMWEDTNFEGSRYVHQNQPGPGGKDEYEIDGFNGDNEISSVDNASDKPVLLYADDGWTGETFCVPPHTAYSGLGGFDNDAESYRFVFVGGC